MNVGQERNPLIYHSKYLHFVRREKKERATLKLKEEPLEILICEEKILLLGAIILTVVECCFDEEYKRSMDSRDKEHTD